MLSKDYCHGIRCASEMLSDWLILFFPSDRVTTGLSLLLLLVCLQVLCLFAILFPSLGVGKVFL